MFHNIEISEMCEITIHLSDILRPAPMNVQNEHTQSLKRALSDANLAIYIIYLEKYILKRHTDRGLCSGLSPSTVVQENR